MIQPRNLAVKANAPWVFRGSTGTAILTMDNITGAVTFANPIGAPAGTVALPGMPFSTDLDTGIYRIGANNLGVAAAGAKVLDVSATGLGVTGTLTVTDSLVGARRTAGTTAVAITAATALALNDSGGIFTVSQAAAYDIDLPSPTTGPGLEYFFSLTAPGANVVTITVLGGAATFVGTITEDNSCVVATGSTISFASTAVLGDNVHIRSISTGLYHVVAHTSGASKITIS